MASEPHESGTPYRTVVKLLLKWSILDYLRGGIRLVFALQDAFPHITEPGEWDVTCPPAGI